GAFHQRQHLRDVARRAGRGPLAARAASAAAAAADEVLVGDELVAVLLHREAGELASTDHDHLAAVLFQLFDQRDEVAVAADDDEGGDVVVVERHRDVGAVLVTAWRHVALHHADGVLREDTAVIARALPVAVGDLGDDLAALLD